ncbi:LLM class F420-dependent oxidoreductase [Streptomyces sp. F001]|uniref:LLM class F420-dependent oxidoreductase n=1 Tax=Streptomyces sp. F001 TaxID=1510026 RepID=UPI00101E4D75|nr:LLM class F420-dependent oxidoreductase [Streptomyces sp. F001]RZB14442.1 LLM class F420-dependent oxidoreductase [Streptomyces sp. F001]
MRLGVHITRFDHPDGPAAEAAGISRLSVMDHYFQMEAYGLTATEPMLEGYTILGHLAAHTSTTRLGLLVTGVTYRHPGLLAKIVTTLDVLSGGRAFLGLGAAWYQREHTGLGVPFPPVAERFERLEETLRICKQMWDPQNNGPFEGRHYQLAETLCVPAPVSPPHPEIMLGGGGEKKTLRLVAQYADACNLFTSSPEEVAHKLKVLRGHCEDVGRDYGTIRKTVLHLDPSGTLDGFAEAMAGYAELGIDEAIVAPPVSAVAQWIERCAAPAANAVAELGGA